MKTMICRPMLSKQLRRVENLNGRGRLRKRRIASQPARPALRFSPTAWAKLLYFRDRSESEVGGFGIASADDLLRIEEFRSVKQEATGVSVVFDDTAVADFFESQVDEKRKPEQFGRIWLHTHPGNSALPSGTDEETFERVFGRCQWAVLFILARNGQCYARLRFNIGPGGQMEIPVAVDYSLAFLASDVESWESEYLANVTIIDPFLQEIPFGVEHWPDEEFGHLWPEDLAELENVRWRPTAIEAADQPLLLPQGKEAKP